MKTTSNRNRWLGLALACGMGIRVEGGWGRFLAVPVEQP